MGNLKFGTNSPLALYMGVSGSTKAYYGTTEVFSGGNIDYSKEYLTFEVLTGGTIVWEANNAGTVDRTIYYSKNNGSWYEMTSIPMGTTISVNAGDIVRFKGNTGGTSAGANDASNYCWFKNSTAYFNVYGNIESIASEDFATSAVTLTRNFKGLFRGSKAVDISNLYLPSPTVQFQYSFLFRECASLINTPDLSHINAFTKSGLGGMFSVCPSLTSVDNLPVVTSSYGADAAFTLMFSGSTNLTYVRNISTYTSGFTNWLQGVSATGTFVKDANATWSSGASGIPSGWTVINDT